MEPLRILLVDDHVLFRRGLSSLLSTQPDFEVIGEAADGFEALALCRDLLPDLVLMDIEMPRMDGLEATTRILTEFPYVRIVMLTVSDNDEHLFEAVKSGAYGYLLKKIEPEGLFEMLRGVSRGEAPISRLMARRIMKEFARQATTREKAMSSGQQLTARERDVLQLVTAGKSNAEIARELHIAESTVKNHMRNILAKLHIENRVQAAAYAIREGLVSS
jgi:DNA-binding NarL/FixJ family response regulator